MSKDQRSTVCKKNVKAFVGFNPVSVKVQL